MICHQLIFFMPLFQSVPPMNTIIPGKLCVPLAKSLLSHSDKIEMLVHGKGKR